MVLTYITPTFVLKLKQMKINRPLIISICLMVLISAVYRAMPGRPWGFAPQWAIALFSGAIFSRDKKWAFIMPLVSMLLSDCIYQLLYVNGLTPISGFYKGQWLNYILFTGMAFYGFVFNTKKVSGILAACIAAPTTYFLLSNFVVWAGGGGLHRPKNLSGLLQCFADGLPFYKNSVLSTFVFSAVLFGTYYFVSDKANNKQLA